MDRLEHAVLLAQSARATLAFRRAGARGARVSCEGRLPVLHRGGELVVGRLALRGTVAPVEIGALAGARLAIGERTFVNSGASVVAALAIEIGEDSRIGDFAAIYDSDYHAVEEGAEVRRAPVSIGRNVWLARGVIVLPGVTIGDHAVVAAGSVVREDVPPRTLVAGNPAHVVRTLSAAEGWRRA